MLTIYKASAGSGKTFQLAYEYIRLVISYKDYETGKRKLRLPQGGRPGEERGVHKAPTHRSILAITFTNKATDEMKRRIIHELALLAGREPGWDSEKERNQVYAEKLKREFGCSDSQIREAAELALDNLLNDFGAFSVSTIDSFFQTVLRTFAREVDLTGNYDIVLDNTEVLAYAVDDMISDISKGRGVAGDPDNSRLVKAIESMMNRRLEYGEHFDVLNRDSRFHAELIEFFSNINNEVYQLHQAEMDEYLSDPGRMLRFSDAVQRRARESLLNLKQYSVRALEALGGNTDVLGRYVLGILENGAKGKRDSGSTLEGLITGKKPIFKTSVDPEVEEAVGKAIQAAHYYKHQGLYLYELADNMYQLVLLGRLLEHIKRFRLENSAIMLSDTNELIARIIGDDDTPFIYERLGQRLRNFLLDEFQDTSRMQWRNLLPLVSESAANGEDSLVIGDVKQCVYRFRNSDPTLLGGLTSTFHPSEATETEASRDTNTNWRSRANIVRVNNAFFENLSAVMPAIKEAYEGVAQEVPAGKLSSPEGYVKFMVYGKGVEKEAESAHADETADPNPALYFDDESLPVVREIERQLQQGYPASQIAVLFRSNPKANAFSVAMQKFASQVQEGSPWYGVGVASDEALTLDNSDAVKLVVSILRFVSASPGSAEVKSEVRAADLATLFHDYRKVVVEGQLSGGAALEQALSARDDRLRRVEQLRSETGSTAAEARRQEESERRLDALRSLPSDPECVTLVSLVNRVVREFVPHGALKGESVYLQAFEDAVSQYVATHSGSNDLRRFIAWWDQEGHKVKVAVGRDRNALTVMTIHKAKGLEFECVHLPWRKFSPPAGYFWDTVKDFDFVEDKADIPPLLPITDRSELAEMPAPYSTTYLQLKQEGIVDETNVLYVAMTRAVTELCVYFQPETASSKKKYAPGSLLMPVEAGLPRTVERMSGLDYAGDMKRLGLIASSDGCSWSAGAPVAYREKAAAKPMALDPQYEEPMPRYEPLTAESKRRLRGIAVLDSEALKGISL